ncbi:hypothetical protein V8F33_009947 [Rhypophila sp. PSN 637]
MTRRGGRGAGLRRLASEEPPAYTPSPPSGANELQFQWAESAGLNTITGPYYTPTRALPADRSTSFTRPDDDDDDDEGSVEPGSHCSPSFHKKTERLTCKDSEQQLSPTFDFITHAGLTPKFPRGPESAMTITYALPMESGMTSPSTGVMTITLSPPVLAPISNGPFGAWMVTPKPSPEGRPTTLIQDVSDQRRQPGS